VLNRPHRVEPFIDSLYQSQGLLRVQAYWLASPEDEAELEALSVSGEEVIVMSGRTGPGDYARKLNTAARNVQEPWLFLAADDLRFQNRWADIAVAYSLCSGRRVVGTQDLGNPQVKRGNHSTHTMVHRSYLEEGTVDDRGRLLHEGYAHNWVDAELVETAKHRGEFVFAAESVVEHLHPHWGKAEMDGTYERGLGSYERDRRLFLSRRRLWA
jgi:hypothetical protein